MKSQSRSKKSSKNIKKGPSKAEKQRHWGEVNNMDQAIVDALNRAALAKKRSS